MMHAKQFVAFSQQVYEFNNKKPKMLDSIYQMILGLL